MRTKTSLLQSRTNKPRNCYDTMRRRQRLSIRASISAGGILFYVAMKLQLVKARDMAMKLQLVTGYGYKNAAIMLWEADKVYGIQLINTHLEID